MFPSEPGILNAINRDQHWPARVVLTSDVPGVYLGLLVGSLRRRGLVKRTWRGGFRLTRAGRARLAASDS